MYKRQHYDGEVKGNTVLRPGEADAGVVAPIPDSLVGMAASVDGNPRYCRTDPYLGAVWAVLEAVRNVACVGASPAAVTDCLNYGNPEVPEVFHSFVEGVRGIGDACRGLGRLEAPHEALPVISGNVSFYNQSARGRAVAPSPIICCVGTLPDVSVCRSLSFKEPGHHLYRVGRFAEALGGSLYAQHVDPRWSGPLPGVDFAALRAELAAVVELIREGLIVACHDVSEGGTLGALAEMSLGPESRGGRGCRVDLSAAVDAVGWAGAAFGEAGAFLVEVAAEDAPRLRERVAREGGWCAALGEVIDEPVLEVDGLPHPCRIDLADLAVARERPLFDLLSREEP